MRLGTLFLAGILAAAPLSPLFAQSDTSPYQHRFEQMHSKMMEMRKATDPAKRHQLMQEHMQLMDSQMQSMHGMMGMPMTGMPMMGGGMMPGEQMQKKAERNSSTDESRRLDMIQQMMEQMLAHQQMMMHMPNMGKKQ